ncbi:hypothetical protein C5S31_08265 [ANME-1 cluster archaeon GoMg2]|nr:hypothetical protein [ANME-1 cluster archaeon GoMg2]
MDFERGVAICGGKVEEWEVSGVLSDVVDSLRNIERCIMDQGKLKKLDIVGSIVEDTNNLTYSLIKPKINT